MRVRAIVAYDGTGYGGFQRQRNAPSIQAELEQALAALTGAPVRLLAAGRTDAGVHAEGQVIAFDVTWAHPLTALERGLNAQLPEQIAVRELVEVAPDFHPRYAARRRWYRYTLYCAPVRNPLVSRTSLYVAHPLDSAAMQAGAAYLVGRHDFAAFGSPVKGDNTVREVFRAEWQAAPPWLFFDIEADAFLFRMVRMVVGTLLRVGSGALTPAAVGEILRTRARRQAGPAVAARGLCLKAVMFEAEAGTESPWHAALNT